ncbi:hypothetical protein TSUD_262770 [Trifolium subterraneum]|nr:hypothetical protein TSUD_262770 [Trifolium subterraneum]
MLSCHYIQKGILLSTPPYSFEDLIQTLKTSLSITLSYFPPLAGRLTTDSDGYIYITSNDAGVDFIHSKAKHLTLNTVVSPSLIDVHPYFIRNTIFNSTAVLPIPAGGPTVTFDVDEPLRERVFHFSRESILKLKQKANSNSNGNGNSNGLTDPTEVIAKQANDSWKNVNSNGHVNGSVKSNVRNEISSFQSLSAQLWRSVTRARKLDSTKTSTFRMAVNCRHRLNPKMEPFYFGNAIQSIPTVASVKDILSNDLKYCAGLLHQNVVAHDNATGVFGLLTLWMDMDRNCM